MTPKRLSAQELTALAWRWALPAILLLAFALRLYRLGDQNVWWDEGYSVWLVRKAFLDATLVTAADVHPPLYYWCLWAWVRLAGQSEFAIRFVSAIAGTLTVALAYALGSRLGGRRAGILAALFLAVARFHVWWSQETRMYILAALAATVTLYVAVRWLDEERERTRARWPLFYTLAAASCLYSIYVAGLAPLVANLYAVVALRRVPRSRRLAAAAHWLGAQVAALLLFVPWALLALSRMHSRSVAEPFAVRTLLILYGTLLTLGVSTNVERYAFYTLPFAASLLAGLATLRWGRRDEPGLPGGQAALLLVLGVASMPIIIYLLTQPRSILYTPRVEARYFLLFAPAFCAFLGWSVVRLGRRLWPLGLAAGAVCLGVMLAFLPGYYEGRYLRDEMQSMSRVLGAYARQGDAVLLISGNRYQLFGYYYEQIVPRERRIPVVQLPRDYRFTSENVEAELEAATAGRSRFWVATVEASIQDPDRLSLAWLDQHFRREFTYDVGPNALILYGSEAWPPPVEAVFPQRPLTGGGGGLQLLGCDLPGREYRAGDAVDLGLYYSAQTPVQAEVQWLRDDGELLQNVVQEWPATGADAGRAAVRFKVWPWYRGGATRLLLRWPANAPACSVEIPGPRILSQRDRPQPERIPRPLDVAFADGIGLRGFDLRRPLQGDMARARAGETLTVDLFWEASQPVSRDYTVFVHLLGSAPNPATGGPLWTQHDGPPVGGQYPTTQWALGQLIADRHVLAIDPSTPPGDYELEVGLYLPSTLERLPIAGSGEDRIILAQVHVK